MPDVVLDVEIDESGFEILCAKVSSDQGELNVRARRSDFLSSGRSGTPTGRCDRRLP